MLVVRWVVLVMLVASAISFVLFAATGRQRFKQVGLRILKWTLAAAFVFFAVLIAENLAT